MVPTLETIIRDQSLFGGQVVHSAHVSDGRLRHWREVFEARLRRRFNEQSGDALERLGEEPHEEWRT